MVGPLLLQNEVDCSGAENGRLVYRYERGSKRVAAGAAGSALDNLGRSLASSKGNELHLFLIWCSLLSREGSQNACTCSMKLDQLGGQ